ncbi:hypothetical protein BpHYR1_000481 [Brachionus plicatilis]|uniref:Uncharacterized protein n=1 Tax=Brachionus plicatilis TaxID=10195 RepID=A0A3M7T5U9_BRAPC|nr:hypothetical protein BpHYR1_000481 [Brachionus plicatilis]
MTELVHFNFVKFTRNEDNQDGSIRFRCCKCSLTLTVLNGQLTRKPNGEHKSLKCEMMPPVKVECIKSYEVLKYMASTQTAFNFQDEYQRKTAQLQSKYEPEQVEKNEQEAKNVTSMATENKSIFLNKKRPVEQSAVKITKKKKLEHEAIKDTNGDLLVLDNGLFLSDQQWLKSSHIDFAFEQFYAQFNTRFDNHINYWMTWRVQSLLRETIQVCIDPNPDHIFILNVNNNHWVLLTNIDPCEQVETEILFELNPRKLFFYDSMNNSANSFATKSILKFLYPEQEHHHLSMVEVVP